MTYVDLRDENGQVKQALMFTHCQWNNLYGIIGNDKEAEEARLKAQEMEERRETSRQMADTWENTYVNIRKQRYEKRKERLLKEQKHKEKRYNQLRLESEREKKKIQDRAKQVFFFERDACKSLHSAYRASETEAERNAQIKFNEKLRELDRQIENKYAESILNDAQRYHEEQEEEKRTLAEKKKQLKVEAKQMLQDSEQRRTEERERQTREEQEDMEIMAREMEQVIENERKEIQRKKAFVRNNLLENREMVKKNKQLLKEEDDEENKALQIIANGKKAMSQIRRQREAEMLNAKRGRHIALANKLISEAEEKLRKEEESMKRAEEEKYKIELDTKEKERQYREMLKDERIQEHLNHMKEQEERLAKEKELLKWEILRRFEKEEINNKFNNYQKEQKRANILKNRDIYLQQIEADIDKRMKEKHLDLEACQRSRELWELSDKEFLEYALKVRQESEKKGRSLYPLDSAIYNYKKSHGLFDKDSNFIWDAKLKRPEGILQQKIDDEKLEEKLQNCLTVHTIGQEDCGCSKRANGLI